MNNVWRNEQSVEIIDMTHSNSRIKLPNVSCTVVRTYSFCYLDNGTEYITTFIHVCINPGDLVIFNLIFEELVDCSNDFYGMLYDHTSNQSDYSSNISVIQPKSSILYNPKMDRHRLADKWNSTNTYISIQTTKPQ